MQAPSSVLLVGTFALAGCSGPYVESFFECGSCGGCGPASDAEDFLQVSREDLLVALRGATRDVKPGQPRVLVREVVDSDWYNDPRLSSVGGCAPILRGTGTAVVEVGTSSLTFEWKMSATRRSAAPDQPPRLTLLAEAPISFDPGVSLPEDVVATAWRWTERELGEVEHEGSLGFGTEATRDGRPWKYFLMASW